MQIAPMVFNRWHICLRIIYLYYIRIYSDMIVERFIRPFVWESKDFLVNFYKFNFIALLKHIEIYAYSFWNSIFHKIIFLWIKCLNRQFDYCFEIKV